MSEIYLYWTYMALNTGEKAISTPSGLLKRLYQIGILDLAFLSSNGKHCLHAKTSTSFLIYGVINVWQVHIQSMKNNTILNGIKMTVFGYSSQHHFGHLVVSNTHFFLVNIFYWPQTGHLSSHRLRFTKLTFYRLVLLIRLVQMDQSTQCVLLIVV